MSGSDEVAATVPLPRVVRLFVSYLSEELCESYSLDIEEQL